MVQILTLSKILQVFVFHSHIKGVTWFLVFLRDNAMQDKENDTLSNAVCTFLKTQ